MYRLYDRDIGHTSAKDGSGEYIVVVDMDQIRFDLSYPALQGIYERAVIIKMFYVS